MEALLSGSLGVTAMISGESAKVEWVDGREKTMSRVGAESIFRGANDVVTLRDSDRSQALESLRLHWMKDRALMYSLLIMDSSTDDESRSELLSQLNFWLKESKDVDRHLRNVLFSCPLPGDVVLTDSIDFDTEFGRLAKELLDSQERITAVRSSWDRVASVLGAEESFKYEVALIAMGAFVELQSLRRSDLNALKFECLKNLSNLSEFRSVLSKFLNPFIKSSEPIEAHDLKTFNSAFYENQSEFYAPVLMKSVHDKFQHVKSELLKIESYFNDGKIEQAEKHLNWLVDEQVGREEHDFAAKTLCFASEYVKNLELFDLQLTYVLRAYEVAPDDVRVLGHLGDAYLNSGDLDTALEYFHKCQEDSAHFKYGTLGVVRVLRKMGRNGDALEQVEKLESEYGLEVEVLFHKAEVLRALERFEEAISVYSQGFELHPDKSRFLCGKAATNVDARHYSSAIVVYREAVRLFPFDAFAYTSLGHLLARLGEFDEGIECLEKGIELADNKVVAINALASALRMQGKSNKAIKLLLSESQSDAAILPEDSLVELLENAIHIGIYVKAEAWLDRARSILGDMPSLMLQNAKLFSAQGKNAESLKLLDSLVASSPQYTEAIVEKSRVLRKIGEFSAARDVIQPLLGCGYVNPYIQAESVLLHLVDVPEDAVSDRAGSRDYATREEWELDRAYGIALLDEVQAKSAWRISLDGKKRSPFKLQRKKFSLLLAVAKEMLGQIGSVGNALKGFVGIDGDLIRAIAFWKLGLKAKLDSHLISINRIPVSGQQASNTQNLLELVFCPYDARLHCEQVIELERNILRAAA